jgi:hypothetical protein
VAATFNLGAVVATPGAIDLDVDLAGLLARHASGDWGDLRAFDRRENNRAIKTGERLFSAYETPAGRLWVITEADRSSTCILLPEEY